MRTTYNEFIKYEYLYQTGYQRWELDDICKESYQDELEIYGGDPNE